MILFEFINSDIVYVSEKMEQIVYVSEKMEQSKFTGDDYTWITRTDVFVRVSHAYKNVYNITQYIKKEQFESSEYRIVINNFVSEGWVNNKKELDVLYRGLEDTRETAELVRVIMEFNEL